MNSYRSDPSMQIQISEGYVNLATEANAEVVPVGSIWHKVRQTYPQLELYHDDKH